MISQIIAKFCYIVPLLIVFILTIFSNGTSAKISTKPTDSKDEIQKMILTVNVHNATSVFTIEKILEGTNVLFLSQFGKRAEVTLSKDDFYKIADQFLVKNILKIEDCKGSVIDSKAFNSNGTVLRKSQDCFSGKSLSSRNKSELLRRITSLVR